MISPSESQLSRTGFETLGDSGFIDLDQVERELRKLWKRAGEDALDDRRQAAVRVATMNLVVLTMNDQESERAARVGVEISAIHPGRLLLCKIDPTASGVTATVSAHCHLAAGGKQICSEQVNLQVGPGSVINLAQYVAPLLIRDLTNVLWVPGRLFDIPELREFIALFDRVIIDAHHFLEAKAEVERFAAWKAMYPKVSAIDMAWLRLEKWRTLTSQLFDESDALKDLINLQRVEVDYFIGADGSPEGRVEALYFISWIASRLQLTPSQLEGETGEVTTYRAVNQSGKDIQFVLRTVLREGSALGDLSRVCILINDSSCRYDIIRHETRKVATIHVQRESSCPLPAQVELPSASETELIRSALEWRSSFGIFDESLKTARTFLGLK